MNTIIQPKDTIIQPIRKVKNIGIRCNGLVEHYLTDLKTGKKEKILEGSNSIYTEFYAALAQALHGGLDIGFTNLFTTCVTQPVGYQDGIVLLWDVTTDPVYGDIESFYCLKTTLSEVGTHQFRATGLYDAGVAIPDVISLDLGLHWVGASTGGDFNELQVATNQPVGTVAIPIATNYTVVWTLTFTVH